MTLLTAEHARTLRTLALYVTLLATETGHILGPFTLAHIFLDMSASFSATVELAAVVTVTATSAFRAAITVTAMFIKSGPFRTAVVAVLL